MQQGYRVIFDMVRENVMKYGKKFQGETTATGIPVSGKRQTEKRQSKVRICHNFTGGIDAATTMKPQGAPDVVWFSPVTAQLAVTGDLFIPAQAFFL